MPPAPASQSQCQAFGFTHSHWKSGNAITTIVIWYARYPPGTAGTVNRPDSEAL